MQRIIFTLLYDSGRFMLSRNFRLQQVGDVGWLFKNYNFFDVSRGLDELMILDVSRGEHEAERFVSTVLEISSRCFIPLTVGGAIDSIEKGKRLMHAGADKLLVNSGFYDHPRRVTELSRHFGRQCIVAGIDYVTTESGDRTVVTHHGRTRLDVDAYAWAQHAEEIGAGEIMFQSIDRDGTGNGLDTDLLGHLEQRIESPVILMGGVGKAGHIVHGLRTDGVDAVATANLFNFIGDSFLSVRVAALAEGVELPTWEPVDYDRLKGTLSHWAG